MRPRSLMCLMILTFSAMALRLWATPLTAEVGPARRAPVVGTALTTTVTGDETLIEVARREGLGYFAVVRANPGIDPWLPGSGTRITLPTTVVLPDPLLPGVTVNLAEFRLYFVSRDQNRVEVRIYPIAIGSEEHQTPEGTFSVINKIPTPSWTIPADIRRDRPALPKVMPHGPENPLGNYWIGLSINGYGIHGTNEPFGVGRRVTHGCIRLYPEDIRDLYSRLKIGTPVRIHYQPIKLGLEKGQLIAEIHTDFLGRISDPLTEFVHQKERLNWQGDLDADRARILFEAPLGVPTLLGRFPPPLPPSDKTPLSKDEPSKRGLIRR